MIPVVEKMEIFPVAGILYKMGWKENLSDSE